MEEFEVDFDHNVTALYKFISENQWDAAIKAAKEFPEQARTWVVRYHPETNEVMWRFLPIHSASAKQPPESVINALINAYRRGAQNCDDQGMLPIHYACGNQASIEVIRLLLLANPDGASLRDPNGMLPLHFMAQWGPSDLRALDVVLFANRGAIEVKDNDGFTPLEHAMNGEYDGSESVAHALDNYMNEASQQDSRNGHGMVSLPGANDAVTRLQQAAAAQEKARKEYLMQQSANTRDERDDNNSMPIVNNTFSYQFKNNQQTGVPTSVGKFDTFDDTHFMSTQTNEDAKKIVDELKKEVDKLRSEAEAAEQEAEKTVGEERRKMQKAVDEMKTHLATCESETKASLHELSEKEQMAKIVDSRLEDKENELKNAMNRNDTLRKELEAVKREIAGYKAKTSKLDNHLSTLSRTMTGMMKDQEQITKASMKHEQYMKKIALERQQKMQDLIDQEVNFARNSLEKQKNNELGSEEMINEALEKQKRLMDAVQSVLSERRVVS